MAEKEVREQSEIEELLRAVRQDDDGAFERLLLLFSPLIEKTVSSFRSSALALADADDLRQECKLALYKAARHYDPSKKEVTFGLYAKICLRNRMISVKRHGERLKRKSERARLPEDRIPAQPQNEKPPADFLDAAFTGLSKRERAALKLRLEKKSYEEAAALLHCSVKSYDNALYRAMCKLRARAKNRPSHE